jgi:hypothetical protein
MIGGLVIVSLSREYLQVEFNPEHMQNFDAWSEEYKLLALSDSTCKEVDEEIVVLSQVISHACNIGYEMQRNLRLLSFNGVLVKNLKHLYSMIQTAKIAVGVKSAVKGDKNFPFVFVFSEGQVIVLDGEAALNAQDQVLCRV